MFAYRNVKTTNKLNLLTILLEKKFHASQSRVFLKIKVVKFNLITCGRQKAKIFDENFHLTFQNVKTQKNSQSSKINLPFQAHWNKFSVFIKSENFPCLNACRSEDNLSIHTVRRLGNVQSNLTFNFFFYQKGLLNCFIKA